MFDYPTRHPVFSTVGGCKKLTQEEALEELRKRFHKTRLTWNISLEPELIASLLGYNEPRDAIGYEDE